jgi:PRC-barrel domain protein
MNRVEAFILIPVAGDSLADCEAWRSFEGCSRNSLTSDTFPADEGKLRRGNQESQGRKESALMRAVYCLTLALFAPLLDGPVQAQSTALVGGATQTTQGYGAQAAPQPLSRLGDPEQELAADWVIDSSGQRVGKVEAVETNAKGRARSVEIALNTERGAAAAGKLVIIPARDLRYDSGSNSVLAELSQSQIEAMRMKRDSSTTTRRL